MKYVLYSFSSFLNFLKLWIQSKILFSYLCSVYLRQIKIKIAIIIQEITVIIDKMRRNVCNQLVECGCFSMAVDDEVERRFNDGRIHWPFKISAVWKCSNKDPGGFGGGRIVNNGGGGRRRNSSFFIWKWFNSLVFYWLLSKRTIKRMDTGLD